MRIRTLIFCLCVSVVAAMVAGSAAATPAPDGCNVCLCANDEVACGDFFEEVVAEQGLCSGLCSGIGSSGTSSPTRVDAACSELPVCGHVGVPAASPLWLSMGVVGLLGLGGWRLKRTHSRRTA
jgi:hypothetical protein